MLELGYFISSRHRDARGGFARVIFRRALDFFGRRHAQNFLDRRDPGGDQPPAVFGERAHSAFARGGAYQIRRSAFQNQLADFLVGVHPLENRVASEKSGVAAFAAADGLVNNLVRRDAELQLERLRPFGSVRLFAVRAQHANEALREHGFERRGDEIRLDAHVHEPRQRAGSVIRMQRGENKVAGERRLHRDLCGFGVTDFADENHVRVVAQNRAQPAREGQPGFFIDLDLVDAFELIFHRVFHRDDFSDGVIDLVERCIKCGSFTGTRRAGDQNNSVRQTQDALEMLQFARVHANVAEAAQRGILPQQAHHDRLAVQHRNYGNADVHLGVVNAHFYAAVLRQAFFRNVEMAQNFDARNDGRLKLFQLRRHGHFLQFAVNAVADFEFVLERFKMDVGGAQFNRVLQNLVDEADDRSLVLRPFVQIVALGIFINRLDAFFLFKRANRVGTDAEAFFDFALDGFAGGENRLWGQEIGRGAGVGKGEKFG